MNAVEVQARFEGRSDAIAARVRELGREIAQIDLAIEIGSSPSAPTRTARAVHLQCGGQAETVLLTREEFLDEFELFERGAVPKLRAAILRLAP